MNIQLSPQYRVTTDTHNVILQESYLSKDGKTKGEILWKNKGYYSGLSSLLESIPDHLALMPEITNLSDLLERHERFVKEVTGRLIK